MAGFYLFSDEFLQTDGFRATFMPSEYTAAAALSVGFFDTRLRRRTPLRRPVIAVKQYPYYYPHLRVLPFFDARFHRAAGPRPAEVSSPAVFICLRITLGS